MPTSLDPTILEEIVRRVVEVAQPDKIILFGSAATGEMTRDSDIDLLVLEPAPGDALDESTRIRRALRGLRQAFDIIVLSTDRFEETKSVVVGIAYPANKYGRVIYEAA